MVVNCYQHSVRPPVRTTGLERVGANHACPFDFYLTLFVGKFNRSMEE